MIVLELILWMGIALIIAGILLCFRDGCYIALIPVGGAVILVAITISFGDFRCLPPSIDWFMQLLLN